jgi:hypothetical protein
MAECLGYRLVLRPGGLRIEGKCEAPRDVLALVREHRDAIVALLLQDLEDLAEERAGILEYQAGFTRHEAEQRAGVKVKHSAAA